MTFTESFVRILNCYKDIRSKVELLHTLMASGKRNVYSVCKVTFPWSLNSNIHVTQMALAAFDNMGWWGWPGTGGSALLIIPQAAFLLDSHTINHLQRGETLLACAAMVTLTHDALAHTVLVSENWSASRQFYIWYEETEKWGEPLDQYHLHHKLNGTRSN